MTESKTTAIQMEIPNGLLLEAESLVQTGWYRSLDEIFLDALRRFLESHRDELMEDFIRQDIEWGLSGRD